MDLPERQTRAKNANPPYVQMQGPLRQSTTVVEPALPRDSHQAGAPPPGTEAVI
jgi:hypothetical protein